MDIILIMLTYMVFFFCTYRFFYWLRSRKRKEVLYNMLEIKYLEQKYKLNIKKIGINKMVNIVCLANSLIFAITLTLTSMIDNLILRLLVMFIILLPLIFSIYYFIAKYYRRGGIKKNV